MSITTPDAALPALPSGDGGGPRRTLGVFERPRTSTGWRSWVTTVDHKKIGIMYGASALFFFVPRALWTAKAEPSTFQIAGERGYDFLDLSTPFPAESYLACGWVGVVLVLLALGVAWSYLDRAWLEQSRVAVVTAYLAIAQVGLWRGPVGSLSGVFGFTVGLLVLAAFVTRGGRRRSDQTPGHPRDAGPSPAHQAVTRR